MAGVSGCGGEPEPLRGRLREVFLEPGVGGVDELVGGAVEDDFAFVEDEEFGTVVDAVVGDLLDFAGLRS